MKINNLIVVIVTLIVLPLNAQSIKRKVTPADYGKWGKLSGEVISPDGKWVTFTMAYESQQDTLFIANTIDASLHKFAGAGLSGFSPDSKRCAIMLPYNELLLWELKSHTSKSFSNVKSFNFLPNGNFIVFQGMASNTSSLTIYGKQDQLLWQRQGVSTYSVSDSNDIAVVIDDQLLLLQSGKIIVETLILKDNSDKSKITWSENQNAVAFFNFPKTELGSGEMIRYDRSRNVLVRHNAMNIKFDHVKYNLNKNNLALSENGKQVYFNVIQASDTIQPNVMVEVWDSKSILEYPEENFYKNPEVNNLLAVWNIDTDSVSLIDSNGFCNSKILPNGKYALAQLRSSISSQTDEIRPADYYSINLETYKSNLVVTQGSSSAGALKVSPNGKYLSYFKDGNYYVYYNDQAKSTNVTKGILTDFNDVEFDDSGSNPGYYSPGWSADSKFVILYDQYDIWLISADGKISKRITNGFQNKTRFRLVVNRSAINIGNFAAIATETLDVQKGILIVARSYDKSTGYYVYNSKQSLRKLAHGNYKVSKILKAKSADRFIYSSESDARPPSIISISGISYNPKPIYQSNPHYINYEWSNTELISYKNSKGDPLHGLLMFPAGYDPAKKYPMVVYIYERLSQLRYDYNAPGLRNPIGFLPANYFLDDYFVLMPDIKYELGTPGQSSVDCVTAAVKSVTDRDIVKEDCIGIIGHSYGGTQTSFIISQTPIFAAAVGSGAVTDPISWYLTMNFNALRSNNWRFESQQFRMKGSPYDDWKSYLQNSTIANASNINTPLLSWSGKSDTSVNYEQGIELHLALRRLKKTNTFLLFPEQGHILSDADAQQYLTAKVKEWFDRYLK